MSQYRGLLAILGLVLAYSCCQAWNFGIETEEMIDKEGEFPWLVSVGIRCGTALGGGSLISKHAVLTAWKVIEDRNASELTVFTGDDSRTYSKELGIRSVVRHPNFSQTTGAYNLALLFLKKPIELTTKVAPINLATQSSIRNLDLTSCVVKGMSVKTLPLPVVSTAICHQELRRWLGASFRLDGSLICAGGGIGRNICEDDGYPLVCPVAKDPSQFQQVGIVNWHINCGIAATPDVYTNVAWLHDWINQQIELNPYVDGPADEDNGEIECMDFQGPEFSGPDPLETKSSGPDFPGLPNDNNNIL